MDTIWNLGVFVYPQTTTSVWLEMVAAPITAAIWKLASTAPALLDTAWRWTRKPVKVRAGTSHILNVDHDQLWVTDMHKKKKKIYQKLDSVRKVPNLPTAYFFICPSSSCCSACRHRWMCRARHLQSDLHQPAWQLQVWLCGGLRDWPREQDMQGWIR